MLDLLDLDLGLGMIFEEYSIAWILALAATILAFIFIIPEKRRANLNAFFTFLHKTFNFKYLVIEKIFQFMYVFSTCCTIIMGIITMFDADFITGLLITILGPIVLRIVFELSMMIIIAIKNIIEINEKLPNKNNAKKEPQQNTTNNYNTAPNYQQTNNVSFCSECGSAMHNGTCSNPNCSKHYNY